MPGTTDVASPVPASPQPASGPVAPEESAEEIAALRALKRKMDPDGLYVGESLPVLRLFRQMEDLNRRPKKSVVILGPSGSGKTELARLLHRTSGRPLDRFRPLQATELSGGDPGIVRAKWAGRGAKAGLGGRDGDQPVAGWLQEYAGGTIFVDELHNLDSFNQEFLRKVLDGHPIPPGAGRGPDIQPDVRLIFATYRDPDELRKSGVLIPDFFRRLGRRYLVVPALNERKEDIPLFVERFREGRVPDFSFLLALFRHDWSEGQVGELTDAISHAAASKPKNGTLTASDLKGVLPPDLLKRVQDTPPDEIKKEVLGRVIDTLTCQGFRPRDKKAPLHQRLAELFLVSKATVSRWLKDIGPGQNNAGGSP